LRRLTDPQAATRITAALSLAGFSPWTVRSLVRDSGVTEAEVPSVVGELAASGRLVEIAIGPRRTTRVVAEAVLALEDRVLRTLRRLHSATPRLASIVRARVASALADLGNGVLVDAIIDRLAARGQVIVGARTVSLVDYVPKLSQGERGLKAKIYDTVRAAGLSPPGPDDWVAMAGARAGVIPDLLALLLDEERLVEIGPQFYLDYDVEVDLRRRTVERLSDGSWITMAELRDLLGTTRKYAVPIGEYLDRIGLTVREGDLRRLGDRFAGITGADASGGPTP
jgi:selenocysteine-specific elongation factor